MAGSAWLLHSEHVIAGQWGFSLDDSWIYATFARNLATGHGYSFNPGLPIGGATGPLYVLVLALLFSVFRTVIWPAKIFGILCLSASSLLTLESVRRLGRKYIRVTDESPIDAVAVLAGLLVALSPPLLWGSVSGMELPLYLLFACLGAFFYSTDRWVLASAAWSLGVWVRPDGVLLALLGLFLRPQVTPKNTLGPAAVTFLILGAYVLFNRAVGGHPLPTSVAIKSVGGTRIAREWSMFTQWLWLWGLSVKPERLGHHLALLLPSIVVAISKYARKVPAFAAYVVAFPLAFAQFGVNGGQHGRYIAYVIPFGMVLASLGILLFTRRGFGSRATRAILIIGALCIAWQLNVVRIMGTFHGWNVQNINQMHRFLAEASRRATAPGDTIAVNDVGAMGYFSERYVIDLVGLITPRAGFRENLSKYKPKFLIVFPDWYRQFEVIDPQTHQGVFFDRDSTVKYSPILNLRLANNTIASRDEMTVYERLIPQGTGIPKVPTITH